MKKIITLLLFGIFFLANAQQKITFGYDSAGNQITRVLCLSGCTPSSKPAKEIKEIEAITEEDMLKFSEEDVVSYYPNPVKEELYLRWQLINDNKVFSIIVYGMSGQILQTLSNTDNTDNQTIFFGDYPRGVYLVALRYKNGDEKTIKIIKQ
ncbi:T9SS type A sorting domain-containing protein [Flavobacterium sp. ASV13]|uniref:T9SS type A sorting domain-containing protein n=1 Tax=Flavobacterium sp. ASV13 TaxID=1506583 RepID=UPI000556038B|nr:T9SS type A sorting domain-containing protein [Flavobacterium sp. ASV13]